MRRLYCAFLGLILACSGGSDPIEPVNRPPTISFGLSKLGVARNIPTNLSVVVDDPDDDPLQVTWTITRGTLTAQNAGKTVMSWAVPSLVGVDTVVVSVTDGAFTRKLTEEIRVCWSATDAPPTFLKARSPYLVSGISVGVDEGTETVIEAGTEILLDTEELVLDVSGRLVSLGTEAEPVVIRPNVRGLQCGDERGWWNGIQVFRSSGAPAAGEVDLNHTEVWYAEHGIRLINDASASLHDCAIRCSGDAGILHDGSGRLDVIDSEVSSGRVHGIVIGSSVSTSLPDSIRIEGCEIKFNEGRGMVVSIDDQLQEVPIIVEFTKFEGNLLGAVSLARASFPAIHYCHFTSNGVSAGISNIFLESGYPNGAGVATLNATCNFFGVNNQATIDATIRDSLDAGSVGTRVDTDPWLTVNPLTTPFTCAP